MKTAQWLAIVGVIVLFSFVGGYQLSARTGSEPGYFAAVEAAGYGGDDGKVAGLSDEMNEFYKSLTED
jgi:hypothetical protein